MKTIFYAQIIKKVCTPQEYVESEVVFVAVIILLSHAKCMLGRFLRSCVSIEREREREKERMSEKERERESKRESKRERER